MSDLVSKANNWLSSSNPKAQFLARQLMLSSMPMSRVCELYLNDNEGNPQSFDLFPMLRFIYDNMPDSLLLKCSRKVLKSSMISNIIAVNMIRWNNYKMLYVAPSEKQCKYFSNNYLPPRFNSPNVKKLLPNGLTKDDVFEKVLENTNASLLLTYAKDDADRTRGPAVDMVGVDECLNNCLISTPKNQENKMLIDMQAGDSVLCFDNEYNITTDRIIAIVPKGKRHTWRITLKDGSSIECTANEKILTNIGWIYLGQLLSEDETNRCPKAKSIRASYGDSETTCSRDSTGRWVYEHGCNKPKVSLLSRSETDRVRLTQSKNTGGVHKYTTCNISQWRLRGRALCLCYTVKPSIRVYTESVLSADGQQLRENDNTGMGRSANLGSRSVVVPRRWIITQRISCYKHTRISKRTSRYANPVVCKSGVGRNNFTCKQKWKNVLHYKIQERRWSKATRAYPTLYVTRHGLQVSSCTKEMQSVWGGNDLRSSYLRFKGVQTGPTQRSLQKLYRTPQGQSRIYSNEKGDSIACQCYSKGKISLRSNFSRKGSTRTQGKEETQPTKGTYRPSVCCFQKRTTQKAQTCRKAKGFGRSRVCCKEASFTESCYTESNRKKESEESGIEIESIVYIGEQDVYDIETEKYHTFFANGIAVHNCQSINYNIIPIVLKTMSLSDFGRDLFAGTPLTSDNTIDRLWNASHTHEWATRCGCGEWNMMTPDQDLIKMIQPHGYCCAKCGKVLDTSKGQWVSMSNVGSRRKGFHLAQPMVPFYNQHPDRWEREIYGDVKKLDSGDIELYQVYNEIFGLSMDVGSKPITLEELKELCVLGSTKDEQGDFAIFRRGRHKYMKTATGVDWGVNSITSRTVAVCGGIRDDGIIEIWWQKIYHSTDYEAHINEIAGVVNTFNPFLGCDAGPDPYRGITLVNKTNAKRGQLIQYARIATKHNYKASPDNAWQNSRMQLHKSDCMSLIFRLLKHKKILLPQYEEVKEGIQDILNEYIESSEVGLVQQLIYSHKPDTSDDWLHALCYTVTQLLIACKDKRIQGFSSSNGIIED